MHLGKTKPFILVSYEYFYYFQKNELDELVEKARDMSRNFGHYFDRVIVNNDLDATFDEIINVCNHLESDPQWVPSSWVRLS